MTVLLHDSLVIFTVESDSEIRNQPMVTDTISSRMRNAHLQTASPPRHRPTWRSRNVRGVAIGYTLAPLLRMHHHSVAHDLRIECMSLTMGVVLRME